MAIQGNLGIADDEFSKAKSCLELYGDSLLTKIRMYSAYIDQICSKAIDDPQINAQLIQLRNDVLSLQDPLADIIENISDSCIQYISEIDQADQFLY